MKLDFDIVSQGGSLDFEIKNTKTINASGGIGEEVVREIVAEATANLQQKEDENLKTESKEIVGAINELHEREDKQGLTEEQVKEVVKETVPDWAKQEEKPEYTYEEIKEKPTLVEGVSADIQEQTFIIKLEDKEGNEIASTQVTLPKAEIPDLTDYVKNTDYATADKAGVIKGSSTYGYGINKNGGLVATALSLSEYKAKSTSLFISKGTLENIKYDYIKTGLTTNTETWTDDEMQSARDLIGAVGSGDIANKDKAGVVKIATNLDYGIELLNNNVAIKPPNEWNMLNARQNGTRSPATLATIDLLVKEVLTNPLLKDGVPIYWTDDTTVDGQVVKGTKTKALELLGALLKPAAITGRQSAITQDGKGAVTSIALATWAKEALYGSIPRYQNPAYEEDVPTSNMGMLVTNYPTKKYHCANKDFVENLPTYFADTITEEQQAKWQGMLGADDAFAPKISNVQGSLRAWVSNGRTGYWADMQSNFASAAPNRYAMYLGENDMKDTEPTGILVAKTPKHKYQVANKEYVDNLPDYLTHTDEQKAKWRGMIGATKLYLHSMTDKNGETITVIDSSSTQKTPLGMVEAFHSNNVVNRNYKGYSIVRTTLFIAGVAGIQIEYLIYSTVSGISGYSITLDLTDSTDTVTEL